ncbi:MAG: tetratricopeptide repeat protein [Pseudohongiellaceae bacterium]
MRYTFKDLTIDTLARSVRRGDSDIKLPDLSFDVFVKLISTSPKPVSVEEFSSSVWRSGLVSEETLAQRITLLRKALGDNPKDPSYIRTARGLGYAAVGTVSQTGPETNANIFAGLRRHRNFSTALGFGILSLAVGLFLIVDEAQLKPADVTVIAEPKSATTLLLERASQQLRVHQARETDRAISMLREALAQEPERFDGRLTLSFALSTKATKFGGGIKEKKEAENLARALINEQPENSNAWSALAYALSAQGMIDESLPAYEHAYQLNPSNTPAISSAAHLQLLLGNFHKALSLENQAKKAGGSSRYAEIQIAQTLEFIGHEAAENWQAKALAINPGQVVIVSEIAKSYLRKGDLAAALKTLAQAEGEDAQSPQILQLRSRIAIIEGDFKKAQRLLESTGTYGEFELTLLQAANGDLGQAEDLLRRKLSHVQTLPNAEDCVALAELAAALGENNDAAALILKAVNLGWRDANWLKYSPYLAPLMASDAGQEIKDQIASEVNFQRELIEKTPELTVFINS